MSDMEVPFEDELGDVLEKAIRGTGASCEQIAQQAGVSVERLSDALEDRSDLNSVELTRLAAVLHLNEVGLCAVAEGRYPLPELPGLPFCLKSLRMPHGVGVANAYLLSVPGASSGILFDTGPNFTALQNDWPVEMRSVEAVFLTHLEAEHAGGLCDVVDCFGIPAVYVPSGCRAPCGEEIEDHANKECGAFVVTAYSTPGHASVHHCYRVRLKKGSPKGVDVLIAGDLIFAGSAGGAYHCCHQQQRNLSRILAMCPENTIIAPGHGPLTTVGHERRFNPFVV